MNTIEALRKLYVALGGEAADVANLNITPEMISAIADIAEGGGASSLPAVTAADNNKLLTVVNGAWDKADAAKELPAVTGTDNGRVLKVVNGAWAKAAEQTPVIYPEYSYDEENTEWVCDRTFQEIADWIEAGRVAIAQVQTEDGILLIPMAGYMRDEISHIVAVAFSQAAPNGSADVKYLTSVYIGHSAMGIYVEMGQGYLSASDPNT